MLTLHLICARDVPALPTLAVDGRSISEWINWASSGRIELQVRDALRSTQFDSRQISGAGLHSLLREFIDPPPLYQLVQHVAILFCRSWIRGGLLGLMFDYEGWDPRQGQFEAQGVPREACAVFVDPLTSRSSDEQAITAIHELGHVFNLLHDYSESSFMSGRTWARGFLDSDCEKLTRAGAGEYPYQWNHMPGGANFADSLGSVKVVLGAGRETEAKPRLQLRAMLPKGKYLFGEPVVLDLELSPISNTAVPVVPELDPGYDALRIWYESPSGERRLFRPFFRYCHRDGDTVVTTRRRPLTHNPRINVGRGGLTFSEAGAYRVWAEYVLHEKPSAQVIASNAVEFEVYHPVTEGERAVSHALSYPSAGFFVAVKGGPLNRSQLSRLERLAEEFPEVASVDHLRYALSNHFVGAGERDRARHHLRKLDFEQESLAAGVRRLRKQVNQRSRRGR